MNKPSEPGEQDYDYPATIARIRELGGGWEGHHPCPSCRMPVKDGTEFCDEVCERELASDRGTGQAG